MEPIDSCLRGGGWAFAGAPEEMEPMDSCLKGGGWAQERFLKKRNPLKITSWVQLHLYEKMTAEGFLRREELTRVVFAETVEEVMRALGCRKE